MKYIESYEKRYVIDTHGRVYDMKNNRWVSEWDNSHGYLYVTLQHPENGKKHHRVNRLVAEQYLPKPKSPTMVVDHKDRERKNNHFSNLRWVTVSINNANRGNGGRRLPDGSFLITAFNRDFPHHTGRRERRNAYNYILKKMDRDGMEYQDAAIARKQYEAELNAS